MKKWKCFLDLDGVLVAFMKAAHEFHNLPYSSLSYPYPLGEWNIDKLMSISQDAFWEPLGHDFWANLPWTDDGKEILEYAERIFKEKNICIMSCPTRCPGSASGKLEWIQKNLPRYARQYLIGPSKEFCAQPQSILIDDCDANIKKFERGGGIGILIPRKWNVLHSLVAGKGYATRIMNKQLIASAAYHDLMEYIT